MKKRRFSITYHEGEIIILALYSLCEILDKPDFENSAYWDWNRKAAKELLRKLKEYKWEI